MQFVQKRAEAGARLLDRKLPGWAKKVNPDFLNLAHPRKCPLGQVFGNYFKGIVQLDLVDGRSRRFGFIAVSNNELQGLQRAWKKLIVARLRHPHSGNGKPKHSATGTKTANHSKGGKR